MTQATQIDFGDVQGLRPSDDHVMESMWEMHGAPSDPCWVLDPNDGPDAHLDPWPLHGHRWLSPLRYRPARLSDPGATADVVAHGVHRSGGDET